MSLDAVIDSNTRKFPLTLLSYLSSGYGNVTRPYFFVIATTSGSHKPVLANIRSGTKIQYRNDKKLEILKTAGYRHLSQQVGDATISTFYLPHLFDLRSHEEQTDLVEFILMPRVDALYEKTAPNDVTDKYYVKSSQMYAYSEFFCEMLSSRVPFPIPKSKELRFLIFDTFFNTRYSRFGPVSNCYGTNELGFAQHLHFASTVERVGEILCKITMNTIAEGNVAWQD